MLKPAARRNQGSNIRYPKRKKPLRFLELKEKPDVEVGETFHSSFFEQIFSATSPGKIISSTLFRGFQLSFQSCF